DGPVALGRRARRTPEGRSHTLYSPRDAVFAAGHTARGAGVPDRSRSFRPRCVRARPVAPGPGAACAGFGYDAQVGPRTQCRRATHAGIRARGVTGATVGS